MDLERQFGNYEHERVPVLPAVGLPAVCVCVPAVCLPAGCVTGLFVFDTVFGVVLLSCLLCCRSVLHW